MVGLSDAILGSSMLLALAQYCWYSVRSVEEVALELHITNGLHLDRISKIQTNIRKSEALITYVL